MPARIIKGCALDQPREQGELIVAQFLERPVEIKFRRDPEAMHGPGAVLAQIYLSYIPGEYFFF